MSTMALSSLATARSQFFSGLHQNGAVGAQGQSGTQLLLGSGRTDGHHDDFSRNAFLFQAYGFFHSDFAERVHRHLDVSKVDAGIVRLDANFHVVIDNAFDSYKNLHGFLVTLR